MAIIENTTSQAASLRDARAIDLAKHLEWQYGEGQPYDNAIVFELARRAVGAEEPSGGSTTF